MYDSNLGFEIPNDIELQTDEFFAQFYCPEKENSENLTERHEFYEKYEDLLEDLSTPLYLLEIAKRILVDGSSEYINIVLITSVLNRIIVTKKGIKNELRLNPEYKNIIVSSLLFLLPYSALYFSNTNEILCFDHILNSVLDIIDTYTDENTQLFNQYITTLLREDNDYCQIIGMKFSENFTLEEQNSDILLERIVNLLQQFPESDFNEDIIQIYYQLLFSNLRLFLYTFIKEGRLDIELFLSSITSFFDRFSMENKPDQIEFEFIQKVIIFFDFSIDRFKNNISEQTTVFMEQLINIVYQRATHLNRITDFQLSELIIRVLLNHFEYIDFQFTEKYKQYFAIFMNQFTIIPFNREMTEPEEILYVDYYDINSIDYNNLSNRQTVFHFMIKCFEEEPNRVLILTNLLKQITIEKVHEHHFFLLSIILKIYTSTDLIRNEKLYSILHGIMCNFLEMSLDLRNENTFILNEKVFFEFTYFFFLCSCVDFIQLNSDGSNESVIELANSEISNLIEIVSKISEEQHEDDFYHIYFTFYCILTYKMINNQFELTTPLDQLLEFTILYSELCISNDSIVLLTKFALISEDSTLLMQQFDQFMANCYFEIKRLNYVKKVNKEIDQFSQNEEEENPNENEEKNEEEEEIEPEMNVGRILKFFNGNIQNMNYIIKQFESSCFDIEKLIKFGETLVSFKYQRDWILMDESLDFFSTLLEEFDIKIYILKVYFELIEKNELFYRSEWMYPLFSFISNKSSLINQEFYDIIINELKNYCDFAIQSISVYTVDCIEIFNLLTRLFEINENQQFVVQEDELNFFFDFVSETFPEENCEIDPDEYDPHLHNLGTNLLKLASFLAVQQFIQDDVIACLEELTKEGQIACPEMRYLIIVLIDKIIIGNGSFDEQLLNLRTLCLINTIDFDEVYKDAYENNMEHFKVDIKHPIFTLHPINGFVFE